MEKEIFLLIIGAIIGFFISIITLIITTKYQEFRERKRALKICMIELQNIDKFLIPFVKEDNNIQLPNGELKPFLGISITEILNFKMTNQLDIFLSLDDTLRSSIYDISFDLDSAENNRKLAIPLLNSPDKCNQLDMYGTIYLGYLKSAKGKIEKLNNNLK